MTTTGSWLSPQVQDAYGSYVAVRWATWKAHNEEADCKTAAAKMMTDFRTTYEAQTGIQLPDPLKGKAKWVLSTDESPKGLTAVVPTKGKVRPEYRDKRGADLIDGPNHRIIGISADAVARTATTKVETRDGQALVYRQKTAGTYPKGHLRINQDLLKPGDVIFQKHAHPNNDTWDHTITVVGVEKDEKGRTSKLTLAIGSFDDLNDANSATPPTGPINLYAYEEQIRFENGEIVDSQITWQSDAQLNRLDPGSKTSQRIYRAAKLLGVEQKAIEVHRWGRV